MTRVDWFAARGGRLTAWLAALICCGVAALAWFGYRATNEWRHSSSQLVERRTHETADLLVTALGRDMRAVQISILDGRDWDASSVSAPYELNDTVASAFARYPYPEVFFAWRGAQDTPVLFARSDRRPLWLPPSEDEDRYPVEVLSAPPLVRPLFARISQDIERRAQYSTFEIGINGRLYQTIARIIYQDRTRERVQGAVGFIVDLNWVRQHYFSSIAEQVMRIAQAGDGMNYAIVDEEKQAIVGMDQPLPASSSRQFPVFFFDPIIVAADRPQDLSSRVWTIRVNPGQDPTLTVAARGARRTLLAIGAAALALGVGLVVTLRAGRSAADTAAMRADFVSVVTHGLKTPVSVIRGIGETMSRGRVTTPEQFRDYSQLLVQEGHRLNRLIDNMLAYARVTDAAEIYTFEPLSPAELIDDVLRGFRRILDDANVRPDVSLAPTPHVRADRTALTLALDNLVDNAVRYSGESRYLAVDVRPVGSVVRFAVTDRGPGIPAGDLARVQRRFARGRSTIKHGSGLGLAIVSRIASDHGGRLHISSEVGVGTTASVELPALPQ